jgi:hypothetical protein
LSFLREAFEMLLASSGIKGLLIVVGTAQKSFAVLMFVVGIV